MFISVNRPEFIQLAKVKSATVSHISGLAMKLKYQVTILSKQLTYFLLEP